MDYSVLVDKNKHVKLFTIYPKLAQHILNTMGCNVNLPGVYKTLIEQGYFLETWDEEKVYQYIRDDADLFENEECSSYTTGRYCRKDIEALNGNGYLQYGGLWDKEKRDVSGIVGDFRPERSPTETSSVS